VHRLKRMSRLTLSRRVSHAPVPAHPPPHFVVLSIFCPLARELEKAYVGQTGAERQRNQERHTDVCLPWCLGGANSRHLVPHTAAHLTFTGTPWPLQLSYLR